MACYLISLAPEMDLTLFENLNIQPIDHFSCVNCFSADLNPDQVQQLTNLGAVLTPDTHCRIL